MSDPQHVNTLLLPSSGTFTPGAPTPSGLTPNTRSEAEEAFFQNSIAQTDSAAPTTDAVPSFIDGATDEAQKAYRRPTGPLRTSSANYEKALLKAREQPSISSNLSADTPEGEVGDVTEEGKVASPIPFIQPGQGVVPLHTGVGVGSGQVGAVKKARSRGLSLGQLGRQQSWSEQDMKHIYTAGLMGEVKGDAGYASGTEGSGAGGR